MEVSKVVPSGRLRYSPEEMLALKESYAPLNLPINFVQPEPTRQDREKSQLINFFINAFTFLEERQPVWEAEIKRRRAAVLPKKLAVVEERRLAEKKTKAWTEAHAAIAKEQKRLLKELVFLKLPCSARWCTSTDAVGFGDASVGLNENQAAQESEESADQLRTQTVRPPKASPAKKFNNTRTPQTKVNSPPAVSIWGLPVEPGTQQPIQSENENIISSFRFDVPMPSEALEELVHWCCSQLSSEPWSPSMLKICMRFLCRLETVDQVVYDIGSSIGNSERHFKFMQDFLEKRVSIMYATLED